MSARVPRARGPILPSWVDLPAVARIAIGVAVGLLALASVGAVL